MQESKDTREKNIEPESTGKWKSQIMDRVCWIMISNQPTDVMWQNRHIFSQQNHALMKFCRKNVSRWACTRSKESINDCMGGTDIVCRLHHWVNENYQQELGCHSSVWGLEIAHGRIAGLVALSWSSESQNEWICSEGWLPTKEDDILKQRQAVIVLQH